MTYLGSRTKIVLLSYYISTLYDQNNNSRILGQIRESIQQIDKSKNLVYINSLYFFLQLLTYSSTRFVVMVVL